MDVFNYTLRKLERFPKEATLRDLTARTVRTIQEGPELVGAEAGIGFMLALWTWDAPDGLELLPSFRVVRQALDMALECIETEVAAGDSLRTMPEEYPVGFPEEELERENPEGPPFLDFENWQNWDAGRWVRFRIEQEEAMRAAQGGLAEIGKAAELLDNIRANAHRLPAEERVKLTQWAARIADEMHDRVEEVVDEMGRANLYTQEGREIQQRLARQNDQRQNGTA